IKGEANVVYDRGNFYPHHNLYYITSQEWDLIALQAVLMSGMANLFVSVYSTKMRGGFMRFQAQYLRRICIPYWQNVNENLRQNLIEVSQTNYQSNCRFLVSKIYNLTSDDLKILEDISGKRENNSK
ncbi:MAG: modification methylase PaeR7I, partial [Pyrinomonadaceae bacterium]